MIDIHETFQELNDKLENIKEMADLVIGERDGYRNQSENLRRDLASIAESLGVECAYRPVFNAIEDLKSQAGLAEQRRIGAEEIRERLRNTFADEIQILEDSLAAARADRDMWMKSTNELRDQVLTLQFVADELAQQRDDLLKQVNTEAAMGAIQSMVTLLARDIRDPGAAKNYVEMNFDWDPEVLPQMPFRRVALVFYREGGRSPHAIAQEAIAQRDEAMTALEAARAELATRNR